MSNRGVMKSRFNKLFLGFVIGAVSVGGLAVANNPTVPVVKACIDNKTKALFASTNGSCPKGRTAIDVGATGANIKSIAQLVSPSVVSIKVTSPSGSESGSGSIYRSNQLISYVITNNHVIDSAALSGTIEVELNNGDVFPANIVGRNSEYDLAVISIRKGNLPEIPIGDSSSIGIGDVVVAFGSPLGLSGTVTSGIVSALNRPVTTGSNNVESFMDAIQTDAAINPGNSGGPLVDSQGRAVGVNSAIATLGSAFEANGNIGLGFSIPFNQARRIADELIATGKSTKPFLGVSFDRAYTGPGLRIREITPDSAAAKAGLTVGTIVRSINGFKVSDEVNAIVRIRSKAPGEQVVVVVDAGSSTKTYNITLGSAPSLP
jgi:putative serine protease PepD